MNAVLLAAFLLASRSVCLEGHPSVRAEFAKSALVLIGTALSEQTTVDADGFYALTTYRVKVDEVLRGRPADTLSVVSQNDSGRFPMDVGVQYFLFVFHGEKGLTVDNCGNSNTVRQARDAVRLARQLSHSASRGPP